MGGQYPQPTPQPQPPPTVDSPSPQQSGPTGADRSSSPGEKLAGFLVTFDINAQGDFWVLRTGRARVGRKDAAEGLSVPIEHPTVSSNHAILHLDPENHQFGLEDCGSANGTLLNGKAIAGQGTREIRDGDKIRFGAVNLIVKLFEDR